MLQMAPVGLWSGRSQWFTGSHPKVGVGQGEEMLPGGGGGGEPRAGGGHGLIVCVGGAQSVWFSGTEARPPWQ